MTIPIIGGGAQSGGPAGPNLDGLPVVQCPICGEVRFDNVYVLRVLSELLSPIGQQQIIPQPQTFRCIKCGSLLGEPQQENQQESEDIDKTQTEDESIEIDNSDGDETKLKLV